MTSSAALKVTAVATGIGLLLCIRPMLTNDWDPSFFLAIGEDATEIREYAEERLGEVVLRSDLGHDGRFFFVQANDPWVLDPATSAQVLDRPLYRSQRMFYPLLASGLGTLGPEAVVWGMLTVNLIAMVLGSLAVASIAASMGMSPWWGLAFALNIGFVSELNIGGAGIVAAAAGFGAVALTLRRRFGCAVALLVVAALSREVSLIVAAGTAWWLWHRQAQKRAAVLAISVPVAFVGIWATYLRLSIGSAAGGSDIKEIGLPFAGVWAALDSWVEDPIDLVVGLALIVIMILFSLRVFRQDHLVGWAFIGFVFLAVLLTEPVWHSYFDISRAIAPVLTAYALLLASKGRNTALNSEVKVGRSGT